MTPLAENSVDVQPSMELFQQIDARTFVHWVDARGRICRVNDAWLAFAAENGWPITAAEVLGQPLMGFIADGELRYLYGLLMARLRDGHGPFRFHYRCDAPDCRRLMQMQMCHEPETHTIEFQSKVLHIQRRAPQALLAATQTTSTAVVNLCSCCKQAETDQGWVEIEDAVMRLRLFDCDRLPRTSHQVCPACREKLAQLARQA
jgi:hypothetical protein